MKNALDFFFVLIKHRKLILISLLISTIAAIVVVFIIPVQYTASVSIAPPEGSGQNMLASIASLSAAKIGLGSVGDMAAKNIDFYSDILKSNTVIDSIIYKHDLMKKWKSRTIEYTRLKLKKKTRQYISASEILYIYVTEHEPEFAAQLCGDYIYFLEKALTDLQLNRLHNEMAANKALYEKQVTVIDSLSNELIKWQKRNSSASPEFSALQISPSLSVLYGELIKEKQQYYMIKETLGDTAAAVIEGTKKLKRIEESIDSIVYSLSEKPEDIIEYMKLKADMEISIAVKQSVRNNLDMISNNIEQHDAGVYLIDAVSVPTMKSFPPKKEIVIIVFILMLMLDILLIGIKYYLQLNYTPEELVSMKKQLKKAFNDPFEIRSK